MNKIILSLVLFVSLASCSSDNVQPAPTNPAATAKVASEVNFGNDYGTFLLDYNSDRTLKSAVSTNGAATLSYLLTYNQGSISNVSGAVNGESFAVDFTYTNGIITALKINGLEQDIIYDAVGNYYEVKNSAFSDARTRYVLNADRDVKEIISLDRNHFVDGKYYAYDDTQKGPLFNSNRVTLQLAMACKSKAIYSCFFGGFRPVKNFSGAHAAVMNFENEFDAEGYVAGSSPSQDNMSNGFTDYASYSYTSI